jgi:hypothetical protein
VTYHNLRIAAALPVVLATLIGGSGVAAAYVGITDLDADSSAQPGEAVSVSAAAESDEDLDSDLSIHVFRLDTGEKLCEDSGSQPGSVSCSGSFEMPDEDVEIRAYIRVGGSITEDETTTVNVEEPEPGEEDSDAPAREEEEDEDAPGPGGVETPRNTPIDLGRGEIIEERDLPEGYRYNNSTGVVESTGPESGSGEGSDGGGGIIGEVIGGITKAAQKGLASTIVESIRIFASGIVDETVKIVFGLLTTLPAVDSNPAVEEVHQLTLTITFGFAGAAIAVAGVLWQIGPVFGVSYKQARQLLPRILVALIFSLVSLPLLQVSVDLSNALVQAFSPELVNNAIFDAVNTAVSIAAAALINSVLLLAVAVAYIIRDVYVLFLAAISPLIALGWAMPYSRRYASSLIGGWWTALMMGPLGMLTLRFTFALMNAGGPIGQDIGNWLYAIASWVLLLLIPWQLYGASQSFTGAAYMLTQGAKHRFGKERERYRKSKTNERRRERLERVWERGAASDGGTSDHYGNYRSRSSGAPEWSDESAFRDGNDEDDSDDDGPPHIGRIP